MSYYGQRTLDTGITVNKRRVAGRAIYRFGSSLAQLAYKASDLTTIDVVKDGEGTQVAAAQDAIIVSLIKRSADVTATVEQAELVDVIETYTVPEGSTAVLLEGTVEVDDQGNKIQLSADTDIPVVKTGVPISGSCRLLQFVVK